MSKFKTGDFVVLTKDNKSYSSWNFSGPERYGYKGQVAKIIRYAEFDRPRYRIQLIAPRGTQRTTAIPIGSNRIKKI